MSELDDISKIEESEITIVLADYGNEVHAAQIIELLNSYALDPMGGGRPLLKQVRETLLRKLADVPGAYSWLAYAGATPVGLMNCFTGFSTFSAAPLLNIHDVYVSPLCRGRGVVDKLFDAMEQKAEEIGCCKVTLEVLEGNTRAQTVYRRLGYDGYELDPDVGGAMFWQKSIL